MIGFVATTFAIFACGLAVSQRLWRRIGGDDDLGFAERLLSGAVIGIAIWLAASWLLAVTHLLVRPALIAVAVAMAIVALALLRDLKPLATRPSWLLLLVAAWMLYALWKGFVLPPQTHDALSYHLPKAAMMTQAHGFEHFSAPDTRITSLPANYELLVADVFVMLGRDTLTEWIGALSYLFFLCATAAMSERWWREKAHRAATVLAVAGAPVLLLHSSADKNDLMTSAFCVAALVWGARWSARGGRMAMLLLIVSLAIAGGTKPNAAIVLIGLAPFLLMRWRSFTLRGLAATAVAGLISFLLLGGAAYIDIVIHAVTAAPARSGGAASAAAITGVGFAWGDFQNLWQVPYLMLTVPFTRQPNAVWVPWRHEYWYWPHYEIFFSHYGVLITILVLLIPICVWQTREANRERRDATAAAVIATAIALPTHMLPIGMFAAMPRYIAFILPVIGCWTVPPLIEMVRARSKIIACTVVGAIVAMFVVNSVECALSDRFGPLKFVLWAAKVPGTRYIFFMPNRAASLVDRAAGPNDTIAIDGAFDTWSYPAYGAHFTRHVIFLPQPASPAMIPAAARWVIIDRSWNKVWEHPGLTDMGKVWQYAGRGKPQPEDVHLLLQLLHDPRFEMVYYDPRLNQAVFERRGG